MKNKVDKLIKQFISDYPLRQKLLSRWKEPLIAYASADDEMFLKLKDIVSPSHLLPSDLLPGAKTVIAYFVPFDESIVRSNVNGKDCSREWAVAYIETNKLIYDLNAFLSRELEKFGFRTAIIPATHNFDEKKLISDWSHRHAAYIAGLGKFGINNMLITEKGCCGRIGSLVTDLEIIPSARSNSEYCLYKTENICKKCVSRCVNNALGVDSFDRHKCYEMCLNNDKAYPDIGLCDVCGKCMVNIPCSIKNPAFHT